MKKKIISFVAILTLFISTLSGITPASAAHVNAFKKKQTPKYDIYLSVAKSLGYATDKLTKAVIQKMQNKFEAANPGQKLSLDNINLLTPIKEIDTTSMDGWYVYDHYDTAYYNAGSNGNDNNKNSVPDNWENAYGTSSLMRPYQKYTETKQKTDDAGTKTQVTLEEMSKVELSKWTCVRKLDRHIYSYTTEKVIDTETGEKEKVNNMLFAGYGKNAYTDFLIYPATSTLQKDVNFVIDSSYVNLHTLHSAGFLFNAGIDDDGYIHGYVLMYEFPDGEANANAYVDAQKITVYKINDGVKAQSSYYEDSYAKYNDGNPEKSFSEMGLLTVHKNKSGAKVKELNTKNITQIGNSYSITTSDNWANRMGIWLEINTDKLVVHHSYNATGTYQDNTTFTWDLTEANKSNTKNYYGFGPIVQYTAHSCQKNSLFVFSELSMSFDADKTNASDTLGSIENSEFTEGSANKIYINLIDPSLSYGTEPTDLEKSIVQELKDNKVTVITNDTNAGYLDKYMGTNVKKVDTTTLSLDDLADSLADQILAAAYDPNQGEPINGEKTMPSAYLYLTDTEDSDYEVDRAYSTLLGSETKLYLNTKKYNAAGSEIEYTMYLPGEKDGIKLTGDNATKYGFGKAKTETDSFDCSYVTLSNVTSKWPVGEYKFVAGFKGKQGENVVTSVKTFEILGGTLTEHSPHVWKGYAEGNTLGAYCNSEPEGELEYCSYLGEENALTVTIDAPDKTYDGYIYSNATLSGTGKTDFKNTTGITVGDIVYYNATEEGEITGSPLANAPTNVGKYVATVSITQESTTYTAKDVFYINRANITPSLSMSNYTYGTDNVPTPSVTGTKETSAIVYYYSAEPFSDTNDGTLWSNITGTSLDAGSYYMKAVIAETTNYNSATATTTFVVGKAKYAKPVIDSTSGSAITFSPGEIGKNLIITIQLKGGEEPENGIPITLGPDGTYNFEGLELATDYEVYVRVAGDDNHEPSDWSKCDLNLGLVKVTFDINGGNGTVPEDLKTFAGGTVTIPSGTSINMNGYTFTGWNTSDDGRGTHYDEGDIIGNNCNLYAEWVANNYTVIFDANGGFGSMEPQTFTYDKEQSLTPNSFAKGFETFMGWAETADGDVAYIDGELVENLVTDGDKTLYAVWKDLETSIIINIETKYPQDVTLTLKKGNEVFGTPVTVTVKQVGTDLYRGAYVFEAVPSGTYDVVAKQTISTNEILTKTQMVRANEGTCNETIEMPQSEINSVLKVAEGSRNAVVEGLDAEAADTAAAEPNGGSGLVVTVTMTIEEQEEKSVEECTTPEELATQNAIVEIKEEETENNIFEFLNIDVEKETQELDVDGYRVGEPDTTIIHETKNIVQIIIPFDSEGKYSIKMHRYHDDKVENFTKIDEIPTATSEYVDKTFYVDEANGEIMFYCRKFSTYAISYRLLADIKPEVYVPIIIIPPTEPEVPAVTPTPEVTPEPTPEVTPEPTPEVTPEPTPEVTPEPTPGEVKTDVVVHEDVPKTEVDKLTEEVAEKLLDEEELAEVEAGASVDVFVDITNIDDTVSDEEKAAVEELIKTLDGDAKPGMYLDIALFKKISTKDEAERVDATEGDMLSVTIEIPEALLNTDESVDRIFHIVRVTIIDGKPVAEFLEIEYDPETHTAIFETNRFATYSIVIEDVLTAAGVPTAPQTGDTSNPLAWAFAFVGSLIAMGGIIVFRRKYDM